MAGSHGIKNRHLEKTSIVALLNQKDIYEKTLEEIEVIHKIELDNTPTRLDTAPIKESLLAVLAYRNILAQ